MASLVRLRRIINPLTSGKTGFFYNVIRPKVTTNEDWMPGPYPKTEEERKKAAKKYGLSLEEYEPYPDDGSGLGDYPKLPLIGATARDPYYPWNDPAHKRNVGEPMHKDDNIMGQTRWDAGVKPVVPEWQVYAMFFGVIGGILLVAWLFEDSKIHPAVMEKQYPRGGAVHYTFEPAR